jgi:predicted nucleotidyltransferase
MEPKYTDKSYVYVILLNRVVRVWADNQSIVDILNARADATVLRGTQIASLGGETGITWHDVGEVSVSQILELGGVNLARLHPMPNN